MTYDTCTPTPVAVKIKMAGTPRVVYVCFAESAVYYLQVTDLDRSAGFIIIDNNYCDNVTYFS